MYTKVIKRKLFAVVEKCEGYYTWELYDLDGNKVSYGYSKGVGGTGRGAALMAMENAVRAARRHLKTLSDQNPIVTPKARQKALYYLAGCLKRQADNTHNPSLVFRTECQRLHDELAAEADAIDVPTTLKAVLNYLASAAEVCSTDLRNDDDFRMACAQIASETHERIARVTP